ncbi:putative reverse transcriptase domain-containing protein [Tanacetum coccineum]
MWLGAHLKTPLAPTSKDDHADSLVPSEQGFVLILVNEVGKNDVVTGPAISTPNPGKSSSYADSIGKPNRTKVNFRTLFTPGGNGIDVVVLVESSRAISERFANTAYGYFLGKRVAYPVVANYWHPDVNLLKGDVGTVPIWVKLHGVPVMAFSEDGLSVIATKLGTPLMLDSYTSDMCMQSWGRSSYARAMIELRADVELKDNIVVFGHVQEECPKNIGTGEMKNLKKPSQTPKGVPIGQKVGFKPTKQVYQHVSKKPTANTSGNKKKNMEPTKENVDSSSHSTTLIIEKIDKIENLIIDGKVTLVDDEGKPLEKVISSGDYDIEDEVASVDNEMASFLAKKDGYGTQSLLEQWKDSYENDDYEYDPCDDDMYEGQEIPDKLQAICDKLDIKIRGRKKK